MSFPYRSRGLSLSLLTLFFFTSCSTHPTASTTAPETTKASNELAPIGFEMPRERDVSNAETVLTNRMGAGRENLGATDWKHIFNLLLSVNVEKSIRPEDRKNVLTHSMYYSKLDFNSAYAQILDSKTSEEAYRKKETLLGLSTKNWIAVRENFAMPGETPAAHEYRQFLVDHRNEIYNFQPYPASGVANLKSYLETDTGKKTAAILDDVVFVVIPGFASHTIADYTWPELVSGANVAHGRAAIRPDAKAAPFMKFYASGRPGGFDVVHPMGMELGFSMGKDKDSADALAKWLKQFKTIRAYSKSKFVLLGYSKGAPIAQNMVANHPEMQKDVLAIITMAGVNQGAITAENGINQVRTMFKSSEIEPIVAKLKASGDKALPIMRAAVGGLLGLNTSFAPLVNALNETFSDENVKLASDSYYKVIYGLNDMSNFQRAEWNLENVNDSHFTRPVTIFNISAMANVADFMVPNGFTDAEQVPTPLIVPQVVSGNKIQNSSFSRDDVFLYATSVTGFQQSPGGLFDAQVAWLDTKSITLDHRPLKDSFNAADLDRLRTHLAAKGISLPSDFAEMNRDELVYKINQGKMNNLSFVDLGEVRGTHWDLAFQQVYKPAKDSKECEGYYCHRFPRAALQASVLETLALYRLMGGLN